MRKWHVPTMPQQQLAIPGCIGRIDIHREFERALRSPRYLDITEIGITLRYAQYSIIEPKLFPCPLRHRAKRRVCTWIRRDIPHRHVYKLREGTTVHTQCRSLALCIVEFPPR